MFFFLSFFFPLINTASFCFEEVSSFSTNIYILIVIFLWKKKMEEFQLDNNGLGFLFFFQLKEGRLDSHCRCKRGKRSLVSDDQNQADKL